MGHFTNIFGNRESEKFGDSWLESYPKNYFNSVRLRPYEPPYIHLGMMWLNYFSMFKDRYPRLLVPEVAQTVASMHACIPHPECSNALALLMLSVAQPQVVAKYPKYERAYAQYMSEVHQLMIGDNFDALNAIFNRLNPNAQKQSPFPIGGKELWQINKDLVFPLRRADR